MSLSKPRIALFSIPSAVALMTLVAVAAVEARDPDKRVRTIYHKDNTKTLSEQNNLTGVLKEFRYNERNSLVLRKEFQVDTKGRARHGVIWDGLDNLVAKVAYGFDEFGRVEEERMYDQNNEVIRRIFYRYDKDGKRLRPVAYTYQPGSKNGQQVNPDSLRRTIATPGVSGFGEEEGSRYENGGTVPTSAPRPIRR